MAETGRPGRAARASRAVLCLLLLLGAACANRPPAPIEDRSAGGTTRPEQRYIVLTRDTLYSIAFRYGLDYRRLAAANGIPAPYTIYPGQALVLREADLPPPPAPVASASTPVTPRASRPVSTAAAEVPPRTAGSPSKTTNPTSPAAAPAPRVTPPKKTAPTPAGSSGGAVPGVVSAWRWPAGGRVTRGFDGDLHKGIDVAGARGDPVRAVAGGRIVYAGSGIAGYGLMLIVRHNDEYLSAYGHNDELLVGEGATVRAGQTIARFGSSGTDTVKLHFEIRRGGRPVDPRTLLPRR